ncbi:MAG TPA: hypothetical protein VEZ46_09215 [Mycobacteriales bacterium]|jgi:hypothetical protein|nr:hypothetical protein [Mycobacteriales bacterium]
MRVYIPSTMEGLRVLQGDQRLSPAPLHGHAVTPALRESYAVGDTEELEYVAQLAAASDSLCLLSEDADQPRRRVVLAAELPEDEIRPAEDGDESSVTILIEIPITHIQSMLVDDPAISDVIARAADAWPAAQTGDDDALFELDEATAHDLMWFAIQEISGLLEDADRRQADLDR